MDINFHILNAMSLVTNRSEAYHNSNGFFISAISLSNFMIYWSYAWDTSKYTE